LIRWRIDKNDAFVKYGKTRTDVLEMDFTKEEFKLLNTMLSESIAFHTTQIPANTGNEYRTHVAGQQARIQIANRNARTSISSDSH
jgi:hypothetical protein